MEVIAEPGWSTSKLWLREVESGRSGVAQPSATISFTLDNHNQSPRSDAIQRQPYPTT